MSTRELRNVKQRLTVDTWISRELPVLQASVVKIDDLDTRSVRVNQLSALTDLSDVDVDVERALRSRGIDGPTVH